MYLLSKIIKNLFDVPGRPVISNLRMSVEKTSEFFDSQPKELMQGGLLLKNSVIL